VGALPALAGALATLTKQTLDTELPAPFVPLRPHVERVAVAVEAAGLEKAGVLWNNLGSHRNMVADYAGARTAYERALAIDQAVYGPDHPNVAIDVNNLGSVLKALGDLAGARAAFERALAIDQAVYGPDHPNVATDVNNLGGVLQALGDLAGARVAFERALAIFERFLPPEHPHIRIVRGHLANLES
jgi:tetratricopeptide (TPR) repeat protein